ncbi:hypothetical protein FPHYL_4568 [Fusarium phyllophilum]|uniref:Uncharacterized protein n=1 Tax=Fusarium phyllophilum TaxID=47803 RepID=A0A8H5NFG4_9HYPO|nr:hypothetical protein FPHYL_4568 [Fusarium phyllophilum]
MDDGDFDLDRIWGVGPEFGGQPGSESESDCAPQSSTISESEASYDEAAQHVSTSGVFDDRGHHVTSRDKSASHEEPRNAPASGHKSRTHETNAGHESKPLDPLLRGARRCATIETVAGKAFTTTTTANYQDTTSLTFRRPIGLDESEVVPYVLKTTWKSFNIEFPEQAPTLKHDYDTTFGNYQVLLGLNGKFINGMEDKTIRTYSKIVALIDQISHDSDDTKKPAPWYSFRSADHYQLQRARQSRQNLAYITQGAIGNVTQQIDTIAKAIRKCYESGPGLCEKLKTVPDTSWMARDIVAATTVCCKAQVESLNQWERVRKTLENVNSTALEIAPC